MGLMNYRPSGVDYQVGWVESLAKVFCTEKREGLLFMAIWSRETGNRIRVWLKGKAGQKGKKGKWNEVKARTSSRKVGWWPS